MSEYQRIIFNSLLMLYLIIKQNKSGENNDYCINSENINLQAVL